MKPLTRKAQQWFWFVALWCLGLVSALLLSALVRWVVSRG